MWNMKHVPHCPQNIWTVAVDQLWLCGWNQAFSPKRLQINKYRNIISVSTRIAATYFFPFHLKLHGVKVVIFCLSLAKVTATSNSCKGTTTWLLLSSHSAKVSDNFFKCSTFITANHLHDCWWESKEFVHSQTCCQHGLSSIPNHHGNTGHAWFWHGCCCWHFPGVPNLCSQRNQLPCQRFCLQQTWFNCKYIRIWKPFHLKG